MSQLITAASCPFPAFPGLPCEDEFCAYDFPCCEGCPKLKGAKVSASEDPMKSIIWRGWINGIAGIKK